jgi:hypothetical protein
LGCIVEHPREQSTPERYMVVGLCEDSLTQRGKWPGQAWWYIPVIPAFWRLKWEISSQKLAWAT